MARGIGNATITKELILSKIDQITIFSVYLGIEESVIINCINTGDLILSPLRYDYNPTCGFRYDNRGKLKFRDFAGYIWGDCFDIAAFVISHTYNKSINISNKHHFMGVMKHICYTFRHIIYGEEVDINLKSTLESGRLKIKNSKNIIDLVTRTWNEYDIDYWKQYNIDVGWLNVNFIYPIDQYYINIKTNPKSKYYYDKKDPCYAYLLGKDKNGVNNIKLYFPNRKKGEVRFITNCSILEGIHSLSRNDYDYIIITKSTKDRICLSKNIYTNTSLYGRTIGVINIPAENYRLTTIEYEWLFNKTKAKNSNSIISLMDNDRTGKLEAIWLKKEFNINPIIIPKYYNVKDISDYIKIYGDKNVIENIQKLIKDYEENKMYARGDEFNHIMQEPF